MEHSSIVCGQINRKTQTEKESDIRQSYQRFIYSDEYTALDGYFGQAGRPGTAARLVFELVYLVETQHGSYPLGNLGYQRVLGLSLSRVSEMFGKLEKRGLVKMERETYHEVRRRIQVWPQVLACVSG